MLSTMRSTASSFFVKILIGLLIASFALWGIGDIFRSNTGNIVASVGDEEITAQEYYNRLNVLRTNMGEYFSPQMLKSLNLYQLVLGDMVSGALVRQESDMMKLRVGEDMLKSALADNDDFKNEKGAFDRVLFNQYLKQIRQSEKTFLENFKGSLTYELLQKTMVPDNPVNPKLANIMNNIEQEQREILALIIDYVDESALPEVNESALRVFYEANKGQYIAPEYRTLHYITLDEEAVKQDITTSENELRDLYFEKQSTLTIPEKRDVTQLLYDNKAQAESAYSLLRASQSMDMVINKFKPTNKNSTSLGTVTKNQLPTAQEVVFSTNKGDFTAPVKSEFGWHIFYVNDIIEPKTPSFEAMKPELEKELISARTEEYYAQALEQFEDVIASGASLQEVAITMGLKLQKTPSITQDGKAVDNTQAFNSDKQQSLLEQGFKLSEGEMSDIIQRTDGVNMVVKTLQITPARQRAFNEVQGMVTQDWKEKERRKAKRAYAREIIESLKNVTSLDDATERLKQFNIKASEVARFTRKGLVGDSNVINIMSLPSKYSDIVFGTNDNMTPLDIVDYEENILTGLYIKTLPAPEDENNKTLTEMQENLQNTYEQEVAQQYLNALRSLYPVNQNNDTIARIIEQF